MLSNTTYRKRKQERAVLEDRQEEYVSDVVTRYVDFGVLLIVVEYDPNGQSLVDGCPPMREFERRLVGGIVDTQAKPPRIVGISRSPVVWYCSADQFQILTHRDPLVPAQLVYGSEGAGKTRVIAMWQALQVIRHIGQKREGGATSPTYPRLDALVEEMIAIYPPSWFTYKRARRVFVFADGSRIRMKSTRRSSKAGGSALQTYNWSWASGDEEQDSVSEHDNVTARLRTALGGAKKAPRIATATAKDDSDWRNLRDKIEKSGLWVRRTLLGTRSPFIDPGHWEAMKRSMSPREYQRRVLAQDVGPERMVYPTWSREHNLIAMPEGRWVDVTAEELGHWGKGIGALVGHDPGALFDVSLILKAYRATPRQIRPFWVVRAEITTEQTTTEQHVLALLDVARRQFQLNMLDWKGQPQKDGATMLVRADPYGNNDARPDRACYTIFRNAGITIHPAAYHQAGDRPGRIPKDAGIEVVNTLLCNAANERRLFIEIDKHGQPVAPRLVKTLESSERDLAGKAETQHKDYQDLSHWGAALRYALWAVERPRLQQMAA